MQKKSSGINVSICGLIPRDEGWSVSRVLINEVNEILKHQCNINGFAFIFQDHGWTFANGSLDCSLFYEDMLHLIEKGNVKLAKSITLSITSRYNHINLSSTNSSTSYSDITRQKVQSTISFLLNEHDFPPLSNVYQAILSNVSESRLYQRKPGSNVKLVSVHVSPVYASSVSELVKPLNYSKPVCSSNATQRNVCNYSSVIQLTKPLNISKPVLFNNVCNVRNVSCYSQLVKTFNVTKSVCSSNASNSVICNSTCRSVSNYFSDCQSVKPARKLNGVKRKRPHERLVNNKNSRQHDFTTSLSAVNISMMSIYFYELVLLFFIFHHNFCNNNVDNFFKGYVRCNDFSTNDFLTSNSVAIFNISHKHVSTSSIRFYHFSFSFYEYSFFINSVFYNIFNVNSVTNILNNDFYITYLFDRDNRFLFCSYKVTGECMNIFHQRKNKSNMSKISIASDNNAFFLVIFFVIFRVFNRKRRKYLKLCYLAVFLIVIFLLKLQIKDGLPSNFTSLQKCPTNEFFNLETITSCHYIHHIILHRNLVCLAITNLKYRNYNSFYQFLLLLSGDVSLNPGSVQISPPVNVNIWEPFNKKGLHFLHININSLLPKIDELKCIANKTKAAIIGITESKLDHIVPDLEVNLSGYDILRCDRNRNGGGVACYIRKDLCFNTRALNSKEIENIIFDILLPKSKPVTIGVFYRPPNQANFMELIVKSFSLLNLKDNEIYLLGDFNINLLQKRKYVLNRKGMAVCQGAVHTLINKYLKMCQIFSLKQLITCPTRVTWNTSSLIDHILTNSSEKIFQSGTID